MTEPEKIHGCVYGPLILRAKRFAMTVREPDLSLLVYAMLLKSAYQKYGALGRLDGTYKYLIKEAPREMKMKAGQLIRHLLELDAARKEAMNSPLFQRIRR